MSRPGRWCAAALALALASCLDGGGEPRACGELGAPVTIVRDGWGVPHVEAATLHDAVYAQGYAQASDRLLQIDLLRRTGRGMRAELLGADELELDRLVRTIGLQPAAQRSLDRVAAEDPATLCLIDAYVGGVNAFLSDMQSGQNGAVRPADLDALDPAYVPPPWSRIDVAVVAKAAVFSLSSNIEMDLVLTAAEALMGREDVDRLVRYEPLADVFTLADPADDVPLSLTATAPGTEPSLPAAPGLRPAANGAPGPAAAPAAPRVRPTAAARGGASALLDLARVFGRLRHALGPRASNNWAVAAAASADGRPALGSDPHGSITIPSSFHEIHLIVEEPPLNAYGTAVAGGPMVHFGHNGRAGWAFTNYGADVGDLYDEELNDAKDAVRFDGAWVPLAARVETIRVRPDGGAVADATVEELPVRVVPHHGPLLNDVLPEPLPVLFGGRPISYRWVGASDTREISALAKLGTIATWQDFLQAMELWDVGAQNSVYAGTADGVGYIGPGLFPVRPWDTAAERPTVPLPGDGAAEWDGFRPFAALPRLVNPPWGFVASANSDPLGLTADGNPFAPDYWGTAYAFGFRTQRIRQVLAAHADAGGARMGDLETLQTDVRIGAADVFVPRLLQAADAHAAAIAAAALGPAVATLRAWDRFGDVDSAGAAIFHQTVVRLIADFVAADVFEPLKPLLFGNLQVSLRALAWALRTDDATIFPDGADVAILTALGGARDDLGAFFGSTAPADWHWGAMHVRSWRHPLGGDFDRGPLPVAGGFAVVNRADFAYLGENGALPLPYEVVDGPDMRFLATLGEGGTTRLMLPAGSSGDPSSPHYDDQLEAWAAGQYRTAHVTPAQVAAAAQSSLILRP